MRWSRSDLLRSGSGNVEFDEPVDIDDAEFQNCSLLNGVRDVHVFGHGIYDSDNERFYIVMTVNGVMLVPDAMTGTEIEYSFDTESDEIYSFEQTDEDGVRIVTDEVIELLPAVIDAILLEAPLQVTNATPDEYPHGEGWRIMTEEEYQKCKSKEIDPRLAKLREFKGNK